ncbi:MAG: DUF1036 domain-containing protein [Pseudomonadota bacterium]
MSRLLGHMILLAALTLSAGLGPLPFATTDARADFRICNDTDSLVGAALGYRQQGIWISEGWFQISAESCSSLIEGDLNSRFYYIYAEDADRGGQWRGDIFLCTNDREFKIEGVEDCFKRGFVKTGFFEIDTGNRANWMVRLTEQSQSPPTQ